MSNCQRFLLFEEALRNNEASQQVLASWKEHQRECNFCRIQSLSQELAMQALAAVPVPELSLNFTERLRARIGEPIPQQQLGPRARLWLRLYWGFAALLSVFILVRVDAVSDAPLILHLVRAALIIGPFALLIRARQIRKLVAILQSIMRE